jgi:hypothetical protein
VLVHAFFLFLYSFITMFTCLIVACSGNVDKQGMTF